MNYIYESLIELISSNHKLLHIYNLNLFPIANSLLISAFSNDFKLNEIK